LDDEIVPPFIAQSKEEGESPFFKFGIVRFSRRFKARLEEVFMPCLKKDVVNGKKRRKLPFHFPVLDTYL